MSKMPLHFPKAFTVAVGLLVRSCGKVHSKKLDSRSFGWLKEKILASTACYWICVPSKPLQF